MGKAMTTPAEIFIIDDLLKKVEARLQDISDRMISGLSSWDAYLKDVGAAKTLLAIRADIEETRMGLMDDD
jgi:hypothetical protein